MRLRRLALPLVGGVLVSLAMAVPAYASAGAQIDFPADGQHFDQNTSETVEGICTQHGEGNWVADCTVQIVNEDTFTVVAQYDIPVDTSSTFSKNNVVFSEPMPTDTVGHFRIIVDSHATGGDVAEKIADYYVDPAGTNPPADGPPSVTISSPTWGQAVNPGTSLHITSNCVAGTGSTLSSCNAVVTNPDGSTDAPQSGWDSALPTSTPGDYGVTVTATDADGLTATAYTWYRVNTPPSVWINNPVDGGVVNQGDSSPFNAGCTPGTGTITSCTLDFTDPNGNPIDYTSADAPGQLPDAVVGIYTLTVTAQDSNGLSATRTVHFRVNKYPTIAIDYPNSNGQTRLYTGDQKPVNYNCDDYEADAGITGPLQECAGPVADGGLIDTSSAGQKIFTVTAIDADGAQTKSSVGYTIYDRPSTVIAGPGANTSYNPWDTAPPFLGTCAGGMGILTCTASVTSPSGVTKPINVGDPIPLSQWGTWTLTLTAVDAQGSRSVSKQTYVVNTPPAPKVAAHTSRQHVVLKVAANGHAKSVGIADVIDISGWRTGAAAVRAEATLYGPAAKAGTCSAGSAIRTVSVPVVNGRIVTPTVPVSLAGYYTWRVQVPSNLYNRALSVPCRTKAQTTLATRAAYGNPVVSTGFNGIVNALLGHSPKSGSRPGRVVAAKGKLGIPVRVRARGVNAVLKNVGVRSGQMLVPGDVHEAGWLRNSAGTTDRRGATILAGHVSDYWNRAGAFNKVQYLHRGQIIKVTDGDAKTYRFRVSSVKKYARTHPLSKRVFQTAGAHSLVLITCTDAIFYSNGHFHYRKNIVVTARPVSR